MRRGADPGTVRRPHQNHKERYTHDEKVHPGPRPGPSTIFLTLNPTEARVGIKPWSS